MTLLLTGFPSFAGVERNPSEQIVAALGGSAIGGLEVVGRVLPVSAERTPGAVRAAIAETSPRLALLLGVAPGRPGLAIERTAVNLFDFPDPDNDGAQPVDVPIEPGAPVAYFATLPLRRIVAAWQAAGIPGYLSESAGLFLCNAAMYTALHATSAGGPPAGFLHLPSLPEEVAGQREQPSMALATQIEGVRLALEAVRGGARSMTSPRLSVCLTFDFDALSPWAHEMALGNMAAMSRGEFGAVAVPRILALLERHDVPASFFIPGHTALVYPDLVREIRDAGHEIGHHGFVHEPLSALAPEQEREILRRGLDALEEVAGVRPLGYRAPNVDVSRQHGGHPDRARLPVRRLVLGQRFRAVLPAPRRPLSPGRPLRAR